MTTYKEIFGKPIKNVSSDFDNSEATGQIWYNTTSGSFKSVISGEAWSSGGPLVTASPGGGQAGAGTQTAGLVFGGNNGPILATTQEYNGTGFALGGQRS